MTQSYRKKFRCDALVVCPFEAMKTYDYFNKYDLAYKEKEEILNSGANGVAVLVTFKRDGFTSTAVMKIPSKEKSKERDNLFHELMLGNGINQLSLKYPCFIRTYGAYLTTDHGPTVNNTPLQRVEYVPKMSESCRTAGKQAILIEYINGDDLRKVIDNEDFQQNELVYVLFQIYYALAMIGAQFTHYDLHLGNVRIYNPGKCVAFEYTLDGYTHRFQCKYVAKIIDYGRSYLQNIAAEVAKVEMDPECTSSRCMRDRPGDICGYKYFEKPDSIKFKQPNISQDLRCLYLCVKHARKWWPGPEIRFEDKYTTPEQTASGLPDSIDNVHDALAYLKGMVAEKSTCRIYGTVKVDAINDWIFERSRASSSKSKSRSRRSVSKSISRLKSRSKSTPKSFFGRLFNF